MSTVTLTPLPYEMAGFGPESLLPDLHNVSYVHSSVVWDDTLTEEDTRWMRYGRVGSILPYTDQNAYDRDRKTVLKDTVVLENGRVRAELLPWMGGRLWSLRADGRELLSRNPVVQPCNLALRNAWCSGGVEWNVSVRGHNMLTCQPLFTELLRLDDGTAGVRFYEYERIRGIVYRLEAYLPPESMFLFVRVHIENPAGNGETPMYWWSNIAVPEESGTRVIAPASTAVLSLYDAGQYRMLRTELPCFEGTDLSEPCAISRSVDVFYDIPKGRRPFVTALQHDGAGLVQCSTERLYGRKLFVWGMGQGGRHWQDFLSDGKTRYVEIQAGIAKTQQDHIPMPDGAVWEWTEAYGPMRCDTAGADYDEAVRRCRTELERILPEEALKEEDRGRGGRIAVCRGEPVAAGSGWGALENLRRGKEQLPPVSAVCAFPPESMNGCQTPWLELLETGRFGETSVSAFPASYMTGKVWRKRLREAPATPAALYHLGIMAFADGDRTAAEDLLRRSLEAEDTAPVRRALARIALLDGDTEQCLLHYRKALAAAPGMTELVLEYAGTLHAAGKDRDLLALLDGLDRETAELPRFLYLRACADTELGRYDEAERILLAPLVIPDMREGELSLCDLWFRLWMNREKTDRAEAESRHPLPAALDFRMH